MREIVANVLELEQGQERLLKPDARALLLTKLRVYHTKEKEYKTTSFPKFFKTRSKLGEVMLLSNSALQINIKGKLKSIFF